MSIFVIGELYTGFKGGSKTMENYSHLKQLLNKSSIEVITAAVETAEIFVHIKDQLKRPGHPIPVNDVWIAAHTFETAPVLLSFDDHLSISMA